MSDWNKAYKVNERVWRSVKSELQNVKEVLDKYVYDPFEPKLNATYDVDESKDYRYSDLSINHLLFVLPKKFATLLIEELLLPLIPSELPKVPNLPPLTPSSAPDFYSDRGKKEYYFNDEKWVAKAKEKLTPDNFNNKFEKK